MGEEAKVKRLDEFSVQRFVDEDATAEINKSTIFVSSKAVDENVKTHSFYNKDLLSERMNQVRETINYIRHHWDKYDSFMASLKKYALKHGYSMEKDYKGVEGSALFCHRDWSQNLDRCGFEAIKLYTTNEAYRSVFSSLNHLFRTDKQNDDRELVTAAIFLLEIVNVELFNLVHKCPQKSNFEGTVYRGLTVTANELESIKNLTTCSIDQRVMVFPLGLNSSTKDPAVALEFIDKSLDSNPGKLSLLYRIHVINCNPDLLAEYKRRFPKSVVSTICAVDIEDISVNPEEKEVLLRGPFLQLIKLKEEVIRSRKMTVLDCVMVNSNRDHWVTAHLGDDDTPARIHFGVIVGITRARYCRDLARRYGYEDDETMFQTKICQLEKKLEQIRFSIK